MCWKPLNFDYLIYVRVSVAGCLGYDVLVFKS